jgi:hypothetical protein
MGCVLALCLFTPSRPIRPEPLYHGKNLDAWIAELKSTNAAARLDAAEVLKEIGPKAEAAVPAFVIATTTGRRSPSSHRPRVSAYKRR